MSSLQSSKAICFCGREHHIDKLRPTMDALSKEGMNILFITANNVFNYDNYETPLIKRNVQYKLIYDFLNWELMEDINRLNKKLNKAMDKRISIISDEENLLNYIGEFLFRFSMRDVIESYVLFNQIVEEVKPDVVFILHEANFWTKILAYSSFKKGVPVVSFQEGMYYEPHGTFSEYPIMAEYSWVYLWGEHAKEIFLRAGVEPERLLVVGAPHLDSILTLGNSKKEQVRNQYRKELGIPSASKFVLFILPPINCFKGPFAETIDALMKYVYKKEKLFLMLKWHPLEDTNLVRQLENNCGWRDLPNVRTEHARNILDPLNASDACLIQESTAGLECLVLGKPLIELNFTKNPCVYASAGVADSINSPDELDKIKNIVCHKKTIVKKETVSRYLQWEVYKLDGKSNERITTNIRRLLKKT